MVAKSKRGRPRRASFPVPRTISEGAAIACYGAVGASDAFPLLFHEWPRLSDATAFRVGNFVKERGSAGVAELARVSQALDTSAPVADRRRLVAIQLRLGCEAVGASFNAGMLRVWLQRRGVR